MAGNLGRVRSLTTRALNVRFLTTRALNGDSATRLRSLFLGQPGMGQPFQLEKMAPSLFEATKHRVQQEARRLTPPQPLARPLRWQSPRL
jgi:hypothetical protein